MRARRISDPDDLEMVYRLRVAAWRARTDYFPAMGRWTDPYDDAAMHWAVFDDATIVAAARLTIHATLGEAPNAEIYHGVLSADLTGPVAVLTRLVVATSHAGTGLSIMLDQARIAAAQAAGCAHIVGETFAGTKRCDQLLGLGFAIAGLSGAYGSGPLAAVKNVPATERFPTFAAGPQARLPGGATILILRLLGL